MGKNYFGATERWFADGPGKLGIVLLSAVAASQVCLATPASCLTTTNTSVAVAGEQNAGAIIAASSFPTADDLNSVNAAGGCSGVDLVFSTFTSTQNGVDELAGNYISTGLNQDLSAGAVTAVFSNVNGADNVLTDGVPNDGMNDWYAVKGGGNQTLVTDYQVVAAIAILQFTLDLNGVGLGGSAGGPVKGTLTGTVNLCLGGTWSSGGTGSTCSGTIQTITLISGTDTYAVALLPGNWTTIGIQNTFILKPGAALLTAGDTYLTSFDESFSETPEPSTFVLLGSALAGIAALRFRKRKQA